MTTCPECGGALSRDPESFDVRVGRRTVAVHGVYERCQGECREFYFGPGEMDAAMTQAASTIRSEEGLLSSDEIRAFRKRVGLTQAQLEDLLGAGPKTVVRWERGTVIQNGATDTLLRLLRDVPEALHHLLKERGIVPDVLPLLPGLRTVSYAYTMTADRQPAWPGTLPMAARETQDLDVDIPVKHAERIA